MNYIFGLSEYEEVQNSEDAIVTFSASWCHACPSAKRTLQDLSEEINTPVYCVDAEDTINIPILNKERIMSLPTTFRFSHGKKLGEAIGTLSVDNFKLKLGIKDVGK